MDPLLLDNGLRVSDERYFDLWAYPADAYWGNGAVYFGAECGGEAQAVGGVPPRERVIELHAWLSELLGADEAP